MERGTTESKAKTFAECSSPPDQLDIEVKRHCPARPTSNDNKRYRALLCGLQSCYGCDTLRCNNILERLPSFVIPCNFLNILLYIIMQRWLFHSIDGLRFAFVLILVCCYIYAQHYYVSLAVLMV